MSDVLAAADATLVREWLSKLDGHIEELSYAGPDPYDALASPILRTISSPLLRRIAIQSVKRSPVDMRGLLNIGPLRMAKTLGLVVGSLSLAPWLPNAEERRAAILNDLLGARNGDGAWGYEFDVELRWGGYRAGRSNIIATAFVVDGISKGADGKTICAPVVNFIEEELQRSSFIAYVPESDVIIHNSNLLGASTLEYLAPHNRLVRTAVQTTLRAQRADGTWPYGEERSTTWVDSFHTAYILQALLNLEPSYPEITPHLDRGINAWMDTAFSAEGPRYYLGRDDGPVDVHNIATSLSILARLSLRRDRAAELLGASLKALGSLRRSDGSFSVRGRHLPYMRWESAHVHRALAEVSALERISK